MEPAGVLLAAGLGVSPATGGVHVLLSGEAGIRMGILRLALLAEATIGDSAPKGGTSWFVDGAAVLGLQSHRKGRRPRGWGWLIEGYLGFGHQQTCLETDRESGGCLSQAPDVNGIVAGGRVAAAPPKLSVGFAIDVKTTPRGDLMVTALATYGGL